MPKAKFVNDGLVDSWGRKNRTLADKTCEACLTVFRSKKSSSRFCSKKCAWSKNGGQNKKLVSWWKNKNGYIEGRIWLDENTKIQVKQHRWVMEGILGRALRDDEDVHHINGVKDDNRPENLEVIKHGDHTKGHNLKRKYKSGYSLNLSKEDRERRSLLAIKTRLAEIGRAAIAKAKE